MTHEQYGRWSWVEKDSNGEQWRRVGGATFVAQTKVTADSNLGRFAAEIQVCCCCLNAQMSGFMLSRCLASMSYLHKSLPPVAQGEISPCVCITTHVWEKPNTCFFGFSTHVWLFPHVCAKTHTSVVKTTLMVTVLCVDFTTHMW